MGKGWKAGLLVGAMALAAQAQDALPTVDQVLARYVTALGGREAIQKLHTRTWNGTLELPDGNTASVTYVAKAPNKRRYTIALQGFRLADLSFNGKTGWSNNSQEGLRDLSQEELVSERLASDFYAPLNIRTAYTDLRVNAVEKVNGADAYVVEGRQPDGFPRLMYFDVASGLLVRFVVERHSPDGPIQSDNYWEDYRVVDGVKVPHTLRQESPDFVIVTRVAEVRHNAPVEDSVFEKPAAPASAPTPD